MSNQCAEGRGAHDVCEVELPLAPVVLVTLGTGLAMHVAGPDSLG